MCIRVISVAAVSVAVLTGTQYAAVQSNGTGGGDFYTAATWSEGVVPSPSTSWEILPGDTVTASQSLSLRGWGTGVIAGTLDLGTLDINLGAGALGGFTLQIPSGGALTGRRIFTNRTVRDSVGMIELTGGSLTFTDAIHLTNTHEETSSASSFLMRGGTLNGGTHEFRLWGGNADSRATLTVIGNGGAWNVGPLTLFNTDGGTEQSATEVRFIFENEVGEDALTALNCTSFTLGGNALYIDFTNIPRGDTAASYSTTLIDYSGTLTGSFAEPVFIGLRSGESATLVHDPVNTMFRVDYTLSAVPEPASLGILALVGTALRRRRHV